MHSYHHNIKTFNNATRHLTRVERSLYRDLIELYYDNEQPLPAVDFDRLARRVLANTENEKSALQFVLDEFFILTGEVYTHTYCDEQIEKYHASTSAKAAAGKASAQARKKKQEDRINSRSAQHKQNQTDVKHPLSDCSTNQEPRTINQEPKEKKPSVSFSEDDFRLAEFMFDHIRQVVPDFKDRKLEPWANTIRLMRERDSVTHRRIAEVFLWANRDSFWKTNIMSPDKLREKFPQLAAKREENNNAGNQRAVGQSRSDRNDQALREYFAQIDAEEDSGGDLDGTFQPEIGDRPGGQLGAPAI